MSQAKILWTYTGTLFDTPANRVKEADKWNILVDDPRNAEPEIHIDTILEWGQTYRLTVHNVRQVSLQCVMFQTLFYDPGNREKFTVMTLWEVMVDDSRNGLWEALDDFLEWGETYCLTVEATDLVRVPSIKYADKEACITRWGDTICGDCAEYYYECACQAGPFITVE